MINHHDLVQILQAIHAGTLSGEGVRAVQLVQKRCAENAVHQGGLARAGNARDAHESAERESHIHIFEIVLLRAHHGDEIPVSGTAGLGDADLPPARQERAREGLRILHDLRGRALRHDLAAVDARAWTDIH